MQTRPLLNRLGGVLVLMVAGLAWYLNQQTAQAVDLENYQQREASSKVCRS